MKWNGLIFVLGVTILGCEDSHYVSLEKAQTDGSGATGLGKSVLGLEVSGATRRNSPSITNLSFKILAPENFVDSEEWKNMNESERVRALMSSARLECSPQAQAEGLCTTTIGMVVSLRDTPEGEQVPAQCTGYYLGENLMATSAHCFPREVLEGRATCASRVAVGLYRGEDQELVVGACREIVEFHQEMQTVPVAVTAEDSATATEVIDSEQPIDEDLQDVSGVEADEGQVAEILEPNLMKPDLVFFQIDVAEGDVLPAGGELNLSRRGLPDTEDFYFLAMTPFDNAGLGGVVELRECKSYPHSVLVPEHVNHRAPVVNLMGEFCEAPPGNSGSLVISKSRQEIVGIIQAYLPEARQKYEDLGYTVSEDLLNSVIATNFSCLESEVLDLWASKPDSGCGDRLERSTEEARLLEQERVLSEFETNEQLSLSEARGVFLNYANDLVQISLRRVRTQDELSPLRYVKEILEPEFACHKLDQPAEFEFGIPQVTYEVYQYLDSHLRIRSAFKMSPFDRSYSLFKQTQGNLARIFEVQAEGETSGGLSRDLPLCEAENRQDFLAEI